MGRSLWNTEAASEPRDRHDAGRSAKAWRWFSRRTIDAAARYRDLSWSRIGVRIATAIFLIVLSRVFPNEGFAPFLLIGAAAWLLILARIAFIKASDRWLG